MKKYDFEFYDPRYNTKIVLMFFALFVLSFIGSASVCLYFSIENGLIIVLSITLLLPIAFFFINRKKLKKKGSAVINYDHVVFHLDGITAQIGYKDISSYLIQDYNGLLLKLKLNDGTKLAIAASDKYGNQIKDFREFSVPMEQALKQYQTENDTAMIRIKTFKERMGF